MKRISDTIAYKQTGKTIELNIEGVIGIPEWWQFDDEDQAISTKEKMKAELKAIEDLPDVEKIIINIDSPGGSVNHAKGIYTALKKNKAEKFVNYTNDSASAATIIGAIAPKENVSISDYLSLLVHEARIYYPEGGTKTEFQNYVDTLEKTNKNIATIYSGQNNLSVDENLQLMAKDSGEGELLTAEKALELGFVGNIEQTQKIAAFKPAQFKKFYTGNQFSKLNNLKMGLFNKEKKAPLQIVDINNVNFAHRGIEVGNSFEQIGSDEHVNGLFELENVSFEVENSKIVSVKEQEKETVNYEKEINELKAIISEKDNQIAELAEHSESQEERITALEEAIKVIRGESSKVRPPKEVGNFNGEPVEKKTAAELSRERQRAKVAEAKNLKIGGIN